MFERFTSDARTVVTTAVAEAEDRGDRHIGTEHLLLGVLSSPNPVVQAVAHAGGVDLARARRALDDADADALAAIGIDVTVLPQELSDPSAAGSRRTPWRRSHRPLTGGAKQTLQGALRVAVGLGHRWIGTEHLLLALCAGAEPDPAIHLLASLTVDPTAMRADLERRMAAAA